MARLTGDWRHAGRCIADRRAELGLTQEQVQEAGGPSPASQRLIEGGKRESIQAASAGGYERALGWESGSLRAILAGGAPTPFSDLSPPTGRERLSDLLDQRKAELGLDWRHMAGAAGMRLGDLERIRRGGQPTASERRGLERILNLAPGGVLEILEGPEAMYTGAIPQSEGDESASVWDRIRDELDADAAEAAGMSVEDYRLEERVARQTRIMREEGDLEAAAELDVWLRSREERHREAG